VTAASPTAAVARLVGSVGRREPRRHAHAHRRRSAGRPAPAPGARDGRQEGPSAKARSWPAAPPRHRLTARRRVLFGGGLALAAWNVGRGPVERAAPAGRGTAASGRGGRRRRHPQGNFTWPTSTASPSAPNAGGRVLVAAASRTAARPRGPER
jgi:hypothetical protein